MYFTGPGLASLPSCEASWQEFVSRADAIVNGATKHVRFHLKGSCEYDVIVRPYHCTGHRHVSDVTPSPGWF